MTAENTSPATGSSTPPPSPPASAVEKPPVSSPAPSTEVTADPLSSINPKEVVFILRAAPGPSSAPGYLVYSLLAPPRQNSDERFVYTVTHLPRLPDDSPLREFLFDSLPAYLAAPRKVHVVVSTRSGLRQAEGFYADVLAPLLKVVGLEEGDGGGYTTTVTKSAETIRELGRELGREGTAGNATVVLLSGDGGVVDLLNGLDQVGGAGAPVIVTLPMGTGNALFYSLHKHHFVLEGKAAPVRRDVVALRTLLGGRAEPLPTFRAAFSPGARLLAPPTDESVAATPTPTPTPTPAPSTETTAPLPSAPPRETNLHDDEDDDDDDDDEGHPTPHLIGAIVLSYGFHAALVWESDTPSHRRHGALRFYMAANELQKTAHGYDALVSVRRPGDPEGVFTRLLPPPFGPGPDGKGKPGSEKFTYLLMTLVSNLERTFGISPHSQPLDGKMRAVYFGEVGESRTSIAMGAAANKGEHVGMEGIGYEEVEEVKVVVGEGEGRRWRIFCVDGSTVRVEKGGWVKVRREKGGRAMIVVS
ncbi:hypothetical protein C8A05DRAFT_38844 [Staphylotrichum tortipilum]|uniref:DAGKc domain-containing protein n=1 Tax=Staphylotrichum tortipilum TaxID=2831512 RepID=A0AAN6MCK7_9PEZI|nr:hypothetical protein C8A05DRAFT_38844 [Staphylotrichum longicolle]